MSSRMNAIVRQIERHTLVFDFDKRGLGEAMMVLVADAILAAMDQETSPAGQHWPDLSEAYAEWKTRHYPGNPMAVLLGHMKQPGQLKGLARVTAREMVQTYGTDELARSLATWFQEGNPRQPPRPFYLFGDVILGQLEKLLDAHFAAAI